MNTNPITSAAQTATDAQKTAKADVAGALTDTDTFLSLLVAQLKNQDPLNPADGTQFVTQLATFSGVEQSTQMRDDLDAIRTALTAAAASTTPSTPSSASAAITAAANSAAAAATANTSGVTNAIN
jgi:flagellar basal-body rod modification protein FlgD